MNTCYEVVVVGCSEGRVDQTQLKLCVETTSKKDTKQAKSKAEMAAVAYWNNCDSGREHFVVSSEFIPVLGSDPIKVTVSGIKLKVA